MAKTIELPDSNLHLNGAGRDTNGNRVIKLSFPNSRAFGIQTNGNLPKTHKLISGKNTVTQLSKLKYADLKFISREAASYLKKFGTPVQKKKIKTY